MKKIKLFPLIAAALLFTLCSLAQLSKSVNKINQANTNLNTAVAGTTQAISTVKNVLGTIKGQKKDKKSDNVLVIIQSIEYGDPDLLLLENAFQTVNGVKNVTKTMKEGLITIEVKYKEDANALWKAVPIDLQKLFKPMQVEEKNMMLEYKSKTGIDNPSSVIKTESKLIQSISVKSNDVIDFLEFKIDGKLYHVDASDPNWHSMYAQLDDKNKTPGFYKAMGMKTGFTGGGSFVLTIMKINNPVETSRYTIKAGEQIGTDMIMGFEFGNSNQTAFSINLNNNDLTFVTNGFIELIRFDNKEGGISEGVFEFSNIILKASNGKLISSNHKLTEGKFRFTVHKLLPVY